MQQSLFELGVPPTLAIIGETKRYPIGRIFCVGRNYAAHAAELGNKVDRDTPIYFTKTPAMVASNGATVPYPLGTANYHFELEFVVAIDRCVVDTSLQAVTEAICGYCCGLDMTRRDLQRACSAKGLPWDIAKDVENGAVFSSLTRPADFGEVADQRIVLEVNGTVRQSGRLSEMLSSATDIIADLARYYHLRPGDLIMTGTPAGVGPVQPGDRLHGTIEGAEPVSLTIGP